MHIAVFGTGAIGSTFAYQLAKAGHSVTVVARGARLARLQVDGGITQVSGDRVSVTVAASLDPSIAYDLVLVTVLAPQVEAALPSLTQSAAKKVMFMFNTFESIEPLRNAVGSQRFLFGFPMGVFCLLIDGKIKPQIRSGTTVGDAESAKVFSLAGIPSEVYDDMQSWLRSHAALVIPLMAASTIVDKRGAGISWKEARAHADAMTDAFDIVRLLGNALAPAMVEKLSRLPKVLTTLTLWALSRTAMLRDLGKLGPAEARMLIDMVAKAAPDKAQRLLAIRP